MNVKRASALVWIFTLPLAAQSEDALRRFFEGRQVRVKLDLPATKDGLDVYWRKDPPANMESYSERIRQFGISIRAGNPVPVTQLRVKGKNIEFQLAGGGYGVAGDEVTAYVAPPVVPPSGREIELERRVRDEPDPERREHMRRELGWLRDQREAEERRLRARARELEQIKLQEIAQRRQQSGSRINLWFPDGRLKEAVPTPGELMQMLSAWVDFRPVSGAGAYAPPPPPPTSAPPTQQPVYTDPPPPPAPPPTSGNLQAPGGISRGMSVDQVHSILGRPSFKRDGRQGDLTTLTETWETADERLEVVYVGGVVVKYSTTSK